MTELLHITERPLWDAARESGTYEMSTRGRTLQEQGFIHCSLPHQLASVAAFLYGDHPDPDELVVLVFDSDRLAVPVRFEAAEAGGEEFPHLYGPLPVDAVDEVVALKAWPSGRPGG